MRKVIIIKVLKKNSQLRLYFIKKLEPIKYIIGTCMKKLKP